jgi:hypothetical protein
MSDITNYAYIWYKKDLTKLLDFTSEELDKIYQIIINYSYPCYLANDSIQTMSEADKKELLEHELLFIQKKFEEACLVDVMIIQIPRVLYDLFNFYYYLKDYVYEDYLLINREKKKLLKFDYSCNDEIMKYSNYIDYTKCLFNKVLNNITELNSIIITNIVSYLPDITLAYNTILETIIEKINLLGSININEYWELYTKRILVLKQVLDFEIKPSNGETLLYRGSYNDIDSTIKYGNTEPYPQSLSLSNSMLSGFVNDESACTLNYITATSSYKDSRNVQVTDKIKCIIKKFYLNDSSNEFSLFFIPPIHPFLQLYCVGELWHPRTKIGNDYSLQKIIRIGGIICRTDAIAECDYLKSNKTILELRRLYDQLKSTRQISVWQKKYLKYKNKYLELKKYLYK